MTEMTEAEERQTGGSEDRRGPGRPSKSDDSRLSEMVAIRFTPGQIEAVRARWADEGGAMPFHTWARLVLLGPHGQHTTTGSA